MKILLSNLVVLIIALICGGAVAEIYLRYDGRYTDLIDENLVRSRAIWDRPPNDIQERKHPDLKYKVRIVFNELQIRNHQGLTLADLDNFDGRVVGVFGDSMTENRRINDEFTFTSLLDEALRPEYRVLNFGVDGYGPDQCFIKYLDFPRKQRLNHVFYLFFLNDLQNIYENQIFDFGKNQVLTPVAPKIDPFVDAVRQFHVTYLLMDSYARLKARIANKSYATESLNNKIVDRFAPDTGVDQRARFHDEYADSMAIDYLSDSPSPETLEWGRRFRLLLTAWDREVEANGGQFTILVSPTEASTDLAKKLFGREFSSRILYLADYYPEGYGPFRFKDDGHWNEKGNLRATQAISRWGRDAGLWRDVETEIEALTARTEAAIEKLYAE